MGNGNTKKLNKRLYMILFVINLIISFEVCAEEFIDIEDNGAKTAFINISIGSSNFGKVNIRQKIIPVQNFKTRNIVKQKFDFSCGSAVTATLLRYYLNINTTEEQVMNGLFQVGDLEKIIERKGFSLLDIKRLAQALGLKATGYRTDIVGLITIGKPAIVAVRIGNYKHFVIFRNIYKGRVFIADPALGNMIISIEDFQRMWIDNIALVIESDNPNESYVKLKKDEMIWVNSESLRNALLLQSIQTFKSFNEF